MRGVVVLQSQTQLLQIIAAEQPSSGFARAHHGRQKLRNEHRRDCHHDQDFDKSRCSTRSTKMHNILPRKRMTDGRPVHGRWVMMGSVLNGVKQAGQIARCDSKMWIRLSLHHIKKTFQNNPGHVFLQIYFVYRFGRSVPLIKERVARLCCVNFPM